VNYVEHMRSVADRALTHLFQGVDVISLTDMPDHPNVGDSAIALGEFEFFHQHNIRVLKATSVGTLQPALFNSVNPVVIHGGGNIGGLYGHHESHRKDMALKLREDTLLIQAPQSINFIDDQARTDFMGSVGQRQSLRIAVRDQHSRDELSSIRGRTFLSPDAVHMMGPIPTSEPSKK
jgi:exopolysaccharide biosynthesis predicted pyruvyltransferase EpsI